MKFKIDQPDFETDYHQIQNYVLQLVAEKKITTSSYVLYSFYRSVAGFKNIAMGYKFISMNTGLSKGNITKCNKILEVNNLIKIHKRSHNHPFLIKFTAISKMPKRQFFYPDNDLYGFDDLEEIEDELEELEDELKELENEAEVKKAKRRRKNSLLSKKPIPRKMSEQDKEAYEELVNLYKDCWEEKMLAPYPKNDEQKIYTIKNPEEAKKYIKIPFKIKEENPKFDQWTADSDLSITVFARIYNQGKLQVYYTRTWEYEEERRKIVERNRIIRAKKEEEKERKIVESLPKGYVYFYDQIMEQNPETGEYIRTLPPEETKEWIKKALSEDGNN